MNAVRTRIPRTRYRQIAEVLTHRGLGYLVDAAGLHRFVPFHGLHRPQSTRPERLRMALEELGVTFIKVGQILSTRPDLLPPDYQQELAKLQDAASGIPVEEIRDIVAAELGRPIEEVFARFDPVPWRLRRLARLMPRRCRTVPRSW